MRKATPLLPTSVVGSYSQPDWLINRDALASGSPPRSRRGDLWRIESSWLSQAQNDATLLAIRDQERAGIDIVTDRARRTRPTQNWHCNLPKRNTQPSTTRCWTNPTHTPSRRRRYCFFTCQYRSHDQSNPSWSVHDVSTGRRPALQ